MLGGVLVFRGITTTHVAAGQTKSKVDPGVSDLQAVFAAFGARRDLSDLIDVLAGFGHSSSCVAAVFYMDARYS